MLFKTLVFRNLRISLVSQIRVESILVKEIKIPVPWGYIAGKQWGSDQQPPILCSHGFADNCNTFARLIPLLPKKFRYVSIDLPGHGRSSHIPPGLFYTDELYSYTYDKTRRFLNKDRIGMLGHSMGAGMMLLYLMRNLNRTAFMISLDFMDVPDNRMLPRLHHIGRRIDKIIGQENPITQRGEQWLPKQRVVDSMIKAYNGELDKAAIELLLDWGAETEDDNVRLRRDIKVVNNQVVGCQPATLNVPVPYQDVPFCLIEGTKGMRPCGSKKIFDTIEDVSKYYGPVEHHAIEAQHSLQLSHPHIISTIITKFLDRMTNC